MLSANKQLQLKFHVNAGAIFFQIILKLYNPPSAANVRSLRWMTALRLIKSNIFDRVLIVILKYIGMLQTTSCNNAVINLCITPCWYLFLFLQGNINKDGLIYADLTFNDQPKGQRKLIIHGLDDMTEYVEVDFTKKADPLPDSEDETTNKWNVWQYYASDFAEMSDKFWFIIKENITVLHLTSRGVHKYI